VRRSRHSWGTALDPLRPFFPSATQMPFSPSQLAAPYQLPRGRKAALATAHHLLALRQQPAPVKSGVCAADRGSILNDSMIRCFSRRDT
jgi:hypothetical protein